MKLSSQLKMNFGKVVLITAMFILFNIFIAFFNNAILTSSYSQGITQSFDFKVHLWINVVIGLFAGIFGGSLLILVNSRVFRRKSFGFTMLTTAVAYILLFIIITAIATIIGSRADPGDQMGVSDSLKNIVQILFTPILFTYFIMWGVIILFTLFLLQVNDKFGPGILLKFIMGKYHHARKEERIFMFLDMRSSTTIAEKIGNEKYFNLLNDMFCDITDTILDNKGEIYQYVGDEIVISWSLKKGIQNGSFIRCFFEIQKKLLKLGSIYEEKYGQIPELKAGIHHGQVMAGEIGIVKKDIIYSGDVLNTTARIQGRCNDYNVNILISSETFELVQNLEDYKLVPIGSIELKGKKSKIDLNTVETK